MPAAAKKSAPRKKAAPAPPAAVAVPFDEAELEILRNAGLTAEVLAGIAEAGLTTADIAAREAREDFGAWLPQASPAPWRWDWPHLKYIRRHLQDVTEGRTKRLMISVPPQFGKSQMVTVRYPVWRLERDPALRVAVGCYNLDHATEFSRAMRRLAEERKLPLAKDQQAVDHWATTSGGSLRAVGVGTGITGKPVDCLSGESVINTEEGLMRIDELIKLTSLPRILSYNHATGDVEYRQVEAVRVTHAERLVELVTRSGRVLRCTGNHRVFTAESGYRTADGVRAGDTFLAHLPGVRRPETPREQDLLAVLHRPAAQDRRDGLQELRDQLRAAPVCGEEAVVEGEGTLLLLERLQSCRPESKTRPEVRTVRPAERAQDEAVLRRLPESRPEPDFGRQDLRPVRYDVPAHVGAHPVLSEGLCERRPLGADEGPGQLALSPRRELREVVRRDAPAHSGAGRGPVREMWHPGLDEPEALAGPGHLLFEPDDSPHRRDHFKQHGMEPRDPLPSLSHDGPQEQVQPDPVQLVRAVCTVRQPVYDLQVEGNGNFFANEILVHNCLMIDDPVKSIEEAESQNHRNRVWGWYTTDLYTRLQHDAPVVLIMTRWHEDDLAGRILNSEKAKDWTVVNIDVEAEEGDPLGRAPGETLCPERFTAADIADKRGVLGERQFSALFRGRPQPAAGACFLREWFTKSLVERYQIPWFEAEVRSWDLAGSVDGDWTVGVRMGRTPEQTFYVTDVKRGRWLPNERDAIILQTAKADGQNVKVRINKDPGQAGVSQIAALARMLLGFNVEGVRETGSKQTRANAFASQLGAGNVRVLNAHWTQDYIDEHAAFPAGRNDDSVDASSSGFNELIDEASIYEARGLRVWGAPESPARDATPQEAGVGDDRWWDDDF